MWLRECFSLYQETKRCLSLVSSSPSSSCNSNNHRLWRHHLFLVLLQQYPNHRLSHSCHRRIHSIPKDSFKDHFHLLLRSSQGKAQLLVALVIIISRVRYHNSNRLLLAHPLALHLLQFSNPSSSKTCYCLVLSSSSSPFTSQRFRTNKEVLEMNNLLMLQTTATSTIEVSITTILVSLRARRFRCLLILIPQVALIHFVIQVPYYRVAAQVVVWVRFCHRFRNT